MTKYGSLELTVSSPVQTFTEPLTLAQVKTFLNLPDRSPTDAAEDALLEAYITAARETAELFQNRDLVRKQWDMRLDAFWTDEIQLRSPLVSVDLVKYKDSDGIETTLTETTDYIYDTGKHPGIVMPPYGDSWPAFTVWPSSAVTIRFTSGYSATDAFWSDAGARLEVGMKLLISQWFNGRIPFEPSMQVSEYPFAVTALFSHGALPRKQ